MSQTPNLSLPYIMPAQAQKHVTHNEALSLLDSLVHLSVQTRTTIDPPSEPEEKSHFWVPENAQGDWLGQDHHIAISENGGWRFIAPQIGWRLWVIDEAVLSVWSGSGLVLVNTEFSQRPIFGVNSEADLQNRLVVKSDAALFSHDDVTPGSGNLRVKLNKSQLEKTASLVFQSDYAARAECGLIGDNYYKTKVSADGTNFTTVQTVDTSTHFTGIGTETPKGPLHVAGLDSALVVENTLDSTSRWTIAPGRSGQYVGDLIIAKGDDINSGQHVLRLPSNSAPTFIHGVAIEDGSAVTSHSSGALAYYKPFDGVKAELSFRGQGHAGNAELHLNSYYHDGAFNFLSIGCFTAQSSGPRFGLGTTTPKTTLDVRGLIRVGHFLTSDLPQASSDNEGSVGYVTDDINGALFAFSDGMNWRRVMDNSIIT